MDEAGTRDRSGARPAARAVLHGRARPEVLLLPGLGDDAASLEPFAEPITRAGHAVVVIDNPGVGRSSAWSSPDTTALIADDLVGVLTAMDVASPLHVVGFSMGGMVAQEIALRHPSLVATLTLAATAARPSRYARELIGALARLIAAAGPPEPRRLATVLTLGPRLLDGSGADAAALLDELPSAPATDVLLAQAAAVIAHDTRARLGEIAAPALVLAGRADAILPFEAARALAAGLPHARLRAFAGGHGFAYEEPDAVVDEILSFIAGPAAARPHRA
jgi:3-oxoadipate enol-lactonase